MPNDNPFEIPMRIKKITTAELAKIAGYTPGHMGDIIKGNHIPAVDKAITIAQHLGLKAEDLWSAA